MSLRDRVPSARIQATMALRLHAREGNLKWVSLLMWAGADPRLQVPNLKYEHPEESIGTALEDAVTYSRVEVIRKIGIDAAVDDTSALLSKCWMCDKPEVVEILLSAGANPNAEANGEHYNPMQALMRNFLRSIDTTFLFIRRSQEVALRCLELAAESGGRWRPADQFEFRSFRRAIAQVEHYSAIRSLHQLVQFGAIEREVFQELMRTPRMKDLLNTGAPGADRLREFAGLNAAKSIRSKRKRSGSSR
jgi:hypothetical protein